MRIGWIVHGKGLEETAAGLYSEMASYRYRAIIPAAELRKRGFDASVIAVGTDAGGFERYRQQLRGIDVAVFGKMFQFIKVQPTLLGAAREAGARTVADVCDDFADKPHAELYHAVITAADAVSTSSTFLAGRIAQATGRRALVIADPYEGARAAPRWLPGARLEAMWFGNVINLAGLEASLGQLSASGANMHLVVVTNPSPTVREWEKLRRPELAPAIDLEIRPWSLETTARALEDCDLVLLPIDREFRFSLSKGPDRMVEALWAGRFVVAQPMPAYEEFRDWAWIGEDIAEGIAWARAHPAEVVERIAQAQEHIAANFAPQVVARAWGSFLTGVREGKL